MGGGYEDLASNRMSRVGKTLGTLKVRAGGPSLGGKTLKVRAG